MATQDLRARRMQESLPRDKEEEEGHTGHFWEAAGLPQALQWPHSADSTVGSCLHGLHQASLDQLVNLSQPWFPPVSLAIASMSTS